MSNWKERITTNPAQCGDRPYIRGLNVCVIDIDAPGLLAAGLTQQHVLEEFPDLQLPDIEASLKYATTGKILLKSVTSFFKTLP